MARSAKPCAKCFKAGDYSCAHLGAMYDRFFIRNPDATEQDLIDYALNRMWALERDNENKNQGKQASRIYKSRNVRVSDTLSKKCHVRSGAVQCMRNAGHDGEHRF